MPTRLSGRDHVLAVDVGGTKVALALVRQDGTVVQKLVRPTVRSTDPAAVFASVADGVRALLSEVAVGGRLRVGIGSAGPINTPAQTVSPVNIPAWRDYPVVEKMARRAGRAPSHCRAGAGRRRALLRSGRALAGGRAGRGLDGGPGAVDGGGRRRGARQPAVRRPQRQCGSPGPHQRQRLGALVAAAQAAGWTGGEDAEALTTDARAGDPVACEVIDRGMRALAAGIASTATQLDVSVFVLGGGVSKAGEVIFAPLRRHLSDFAVLDYVADIEVRPATLDNAGLLGAAALGFTLSAAG